MKSQSDKILKFMMQGYTITPLTALHLFGCMRLGARIYDLKQQGINIKEKTICRNNKHYSGYFISGITSQGA